MLRAPMIRYREDRLLHPLHAPCMMLPPAWQHRSVALGESGDSGVRAEKTVQLCAVRCVCEFHRIELIPPHFFNRPRLSLISLDVRS